MSNQTNSSNFDKLRNYFQHQIKESEHSSSIIFLLLLAPIYIIFLFIAFELTEVRSILIFGFIQGAFYALLALGFAIIFGISKMFKLSFGGYFVLGAYTAYWLNKLLFMNFNDISLSDYSGVSRISFTFFYYIVPILFIASLGYHYRLFDWKLATINIPVNLILFVIHRELIVSKFGVFNVTATYQALFIQIGIMAFGMGIHYLELSDMQIIYSVGFLNFLCLILNLFGNMPASPAVYIAVLLVSVLFVATMSMLVDRYILDKVRDNQTNVLIITFGIALFIQSFIPLLRYPWRVSDLADYEFIPFGIENKSLETIVPKSENVLIFGQNVSSIRVIAAVVSILLLILILVFIRQTRMGKAMLAVSEDPEAGWLVGINVRKVYLVSAGLGMGLAAVAGVLTSPFAASPNWGPFMGWSPLIFAIAVVTLGGIGSISGSAIAGFILGFTEATIATFNAELSEIVPLLVIFVIIIFQPKGLFGVEEDHE